MDESTADLLTASLREMFRARPDDLAAALDELGWEEVAADDPPRASRLLFTEHGRAVAASALLDRVVLAELPASDATRAVAYDVGDRFVLLRDPAGVQEIVAVRGARAAVLPVANVSATPADGFGTGWFTADIEPEFTLDAGRAVAAARRAVAAELTGLCATVVETVTRHVTDRVQYGRPIGSFQAVRHRIAEAHVAVVSAGEVLDVAWRHADSDAAAHTAVLAKLRAGRAQESVLRTAVQLFGAIGITLEHELHHAVTRAACLDLLLGSHTTLAADLGRDLLAGPWPDRVVTI